MALVHCSGEENKKDNWFSSVEKTGVTNGVQKAFKWPTSCTAACPV